MTGDPNYPKIKKACAFQIPEPRYDFGGVVRSDFHYQIFQFKEHLIALEKGFRMTPKPPLYDEKMTIGKGKKLEQSQPEIPEIFPGAESSLAPKLPSFANVHFFRRTEAVLVSFESPSRGLPEAL